MKALVVAMGLTLSFGVFADDLIMECSNSDGSVVFTNHNGYNTLSVKTDKTEVLTSLAQVTMEFRNEVVIKESISEFYPFTQFKVASSIVTVTAMEGFTDLFEITHGASSFETEWVCTSTLTHILP